mmetsp:Transcript_26216/g.61865  ORF Transcript_26216/g.61865 Transcript_26216/m.61865 type:complete len:371 (-) Transcript_26216:639-1751(-)
MAPGAGQAGQQRDQPHRIAATAHALQAVVHADGRGGGRAVVAGQAAHLVGADAADLGHPLGRPGQRLGAQLLPAVDMAVDVVLVQPVVRDQLMHQAQRQRAVGARQHGDVLVAFVGRLGLARVDADQLGAVTLGLVGISPEVQVGRDAVAAPDDDELGAREMPRVHAELVAIGGRQAGRAGGGTNGAVQPRGAQRIPQAAGHGFALDQAHGAGIAVGLDALRVARRDGLQPRGDVGQRLGPAHAHKGRRLGLFADALERMQQALRVVGALGVARDLGAQRTMRAGMLGTPLDLDDLLVLHCDLQRAGVRAIMGAGAKDGAGGHRGNRGSVGGRIVASPAAPRTARGSARAGFKPRPGAAGESRCRSGSRH